MRLSGTKTGSANQYCGLGNQLYDLAGSRPSLDLRFAESKSLNDSITGSNLITFTRSSTATYYDSAGVIQTASTDTPRFDHDPVTGECLGLLIEDARTNLFPYSEIQIGSDGWSQSSGQTPVDLSLNALGVFDGVRLTSNGQTWHGIKTNLGQLPTLTASTSYVYSVWFKPGDLDPSNKLRLQIRDTSLGSGLLVRKTISSSDHFSASSYTVGSVPTQGTAEVLSVENAGDSVIRLNIKFVPAATSTNYQVNIGPNTGTVGKSIIALGFQIEEDENPSSYIPTNGSTATRSVDVANITGTNFSSWYGNNEGTVFSECLFRSNGGTTQFSYAFSDGLTTDEIYQYKQINNDNVTFTIRDSVDGTTFNQNHQNAMQYGQQTKGAIAFASNNAFSDVDDRTEKTQDNSVTMPVLNQIRFGERVNGSGRPFLTINRFTYWPSRLPNDTLGTITKQF